jgi:FixJ family two-component response regulator
VIFITAHADVSTAVAAMKSGAIEFLEKPFDRETLVNRIGKALEVDQQWRQTDARYRELDDVVQQLSPTDRETLEMIIRGETNKAMAAHFFISVRAVELRRQRLMTRLGVRSVPELMELTITHRLLAELRSAEKIWPLR